MDIKIENGNQSLTLFCWLSNSCENFVDTMSHYKQGITLEVIKTAKLERFEDDADGGIEQCDEGLLEKSGFGKGLESIAKTNEKYKGRMICHNYHKKNPSQIVHEERQVGRIIKEVRD